MMRALHIRKVCRLVNPGNHKLVVSTPDLSYLWG
jgi:hypothetical protein